MPTVRLATRDDIPRLQVIRAEVRENVLRNPGRVTTRDYEEHIDGRGRTWVAEIAGTLVGFVSADGEQELYGACIRAGITLLSIGHRPALKRFHSRIVHFEGEGGGKGWSVEELRARDVDGLAAP